MGPVSLGTVGETLVRLQARSSGILRVLLLAGCILPSAPYTSGGDGLHVLDGPSGSPQPPLQPIPFPRLLQLVGEAGSPVQVADLLRQVSAGSHGIRRGCESVAGVRAGRRTARLFALSGKVQSSSSLAS